MFLPLPPINVSNSINSTESKYPCGFAWYASHCALTVAAKAVIVSLSANFSAAVANVFSTPAASANSFLSWYGVLAAFIPPVERTELPPAIGWLSTTITFLPASVAVIAAVIPAPPAPTTTTSTVSSISFAFVAVVFLLVKSDGSSPACFKAAVAASMIALDVCVAPDTPSTSNELAATIAPGIVSAAFEPIPFVS